MALLGKRPFNPNAYVPPVDVAAPPVPAPMTNAIRQLPSAPELKTPAKHNWIGILADALSGLAGGGPIYAPMAARRQDEQTAFERGEEQYQRRRKDNLEDQYSLLAYKQGHPDDQLTQYLDLAGISDPAQRANFYRQKAEAMTAPPMMSAQGVDEQGNPVLRFFPRAAPVPKIIPTLPPGVVPLGGAGSQAPRPFP